MHKYRSLGILLRSGTSTSYLFGLSVFQKPCDLLERFLFIWHKPREHVLMGRKCTQCGLTEARKNLPPQPASQPDQNQLCNFFLERFLFFIFFFTTARPVYFLYACAFLLHSGKYSPAHRPHVVPCAYRDPRFEIQTITC